MKQGVANRDVYSDRWQEFPRRLVHQISATDFRGRASGGVYLQGRGNELAAAKPGRDISASFLTCGNHDGHPWGRMSAIPTVPDHGGPRVTPQRFNLFRSSPGDPGAAGARAHRLGVRQLAPSRAEVAKADPAGARWASTGGPGPSYQEKKKQGGGGGDHGGARALVMSV